MSAALNRCFPCAVRPDVDDGWTAPLLPRVSLWSVRVTWTYHDMEGESALQRYADTIFVTCLNVQLFRHVYSVLSGNRL